MRNLKRALSLALASIMVVGMMVVGAGAASFDKFTDKDEIVNKDAVSMVTELGIIAGLTDGSFGPTKNIDRASFARLICVALNGGKEPMLGNIKTTFTDTQGNWAEKYIAYCVDRGIIAGKGNNTFAPSANVTGSEAAKMLLVALGYVAANEGIGGATWQITTDVLANQAGLYDGLSSLNTSTALTRDQAAQMIYNTLNGDMVKYEIIPGVNANGQITANTQREKTGKTMLEDKFGVVTVEGIVVANEYADLKNGGNALKDGKTSVKITNTDAQKTFSGEKTFNVTSGASVLGRSVTLYVKPSATASSAADKATVVGSPLVSSTNTVVVDSSRDSLKDVASDNKVNFDTTSDADSGKLTMVSKNYGAPTTLKAEIASDSKFTTKDGVRGEVRTLVDNNDDSTIDYVIYETYALGKVTKYSTSGDGAITINGTSSLAFDDKADVVGFENVAKNDFVMYAVIGGKLRVQKAESVTGKLTAYTSNKNLTVDGTRINTSDLAFYNDNSKLLNANSYQNLDKTATFYKDTVGNIVAVDGTAASNNYAFLIKAAPKGGVSSDVEVKVVLDDGTTKTYTLDEDNSTGIVTVSGGSTTYGKNLLCTYTLSDDSIELDAVTLTTGAEVNNTKLVIKKGNASVTGISNAASAANRGYADASTVFFYVSPKGTYTADTTDSIASTLVVDETSVYVGKDNVSGLDTTTDFMYVVEDGDIKAVVAVTDSVGTSSDYMYLYKAEGRNSDGFLFDAIINGELKTNVVVTSNTDLGLYTYSTTSKGFYKVASLVSDTATVTGFVTRIDGNSVIIGGNEYKLNSNTVIANIDGGDTELGAVINKGDYVTVKYDNKTDKNLEAVYVTAPYGDDKADILATGSRWTVTSTTNSYAGTTADSTNTAAKLLEDVVVSYGATAKVYTTKVANSTATTGQIQVGADVYHTEATTLTTGTYYVLVTSENGGTISVYDVAVTIS